MTPKVKDQKSLKLDYKPLIGSFVRHLGFKPHEVMDLTPMEYFAIVEEIKPIVEDFDEDELQELEKMMAIATRGNN